MRDFSGLARKAATQHGLLTTAQLRSLGCSRHVQARLVRQGLLIQARVGVLRLVGAEPTWEQALLAAVLTPGAPLVASHRSALRLWGLRTRFDGIELAVRRPACRRISGATVHRSVDLVSTDVVEVAGIPCTNAVRTLCDAGLIFPPHEVQRLVDHGVASGLVDLADLRAIRRRVGEHGRTGVVSLEHALDRVPPGASGESGPELALCRMLVAAGLPRPDTQYEVVVLGCRYRIDLAYPDARLAIEYDGIEAHSGPRAFVVDRDRQNDLVAAGWRVVRVTGAALRDRPWVIVQRIRRLLETDPGAQTPLGAA